MVEEGMGRDQWPPPPNGPVWRRHINIYINLSYGTYMSSKYYTIAKNVNIDYTFGELGVAFSNWLLNTAPQKSDFPTQSLTSRGRRQAWSCRGSLVTPHLTERHASPLWAEPREQGDGLIAHRQGRAGRGSRQWTSRRSSQGPPACVSGVPLTSRPFSVDFMYFPQQVSRCLGQEKGPVKAGWINGAFREPFSLILFCHLQCSVKFIQWILTFRYYIF